MKFQDSLDKQSALPTTEALPDSTASRLLGAAAALFRQKGYANASTRELAALLGIQKATLYYHITKKEDLLYALCVDSLQHICREVEQAMAQQNEPLARLSALIATHMRVTLANPDKYTIVLIELHELSAERHAAVLHLVDNYEKLVCATITHAQEAGQLRREPPAKYQTLALLNLLNWSVFWFHPDGELTPEQLGTLLTSLFLEGTLAR
jgi:TetR/AcrR family transcriptional regulator, cholesterol catabolism regulator